jgi:hypothetical protein
MTLTKEDAICLSIKELNDLEALQQKIIHNLLCPYDAFKHLYEDPEPLKKQLQGAFLLGDKMYISIIHYPYGTKNGKVWGIFGGYGSKSYKNIGPLLKHIGKYKRTIENWNRERNQ